MARTISMRMTWAQAAQIIAAALENGTDTGRDAARAELARMARILDEIQPAPEPPPATAPAPVDLWEVIAEPRDKRSPAFGQTFADEAAALGYARGMRGAGYHADVSPVFATQPTAAAALAEAARFYEDADLAATAQQTAAAAAGRRAEAEGRRVIYIHGRPYADPGDE